MTNLCSAIFKTLIIACFASVMIFHHWSWDEWCDEWGTHDGGLEQNLDVLTDTGAKGHSYAFHGTYDCTEKNNTDNRAYLAFYSCTLLVSVIGICCLAAGEGGAGVYGGCLTMLWVWWIIMEGLRVDKLHQVWEDAFGSEHDLTRTNLTFYAGQFLMYTFMMLGTSLEVFDCFDCDCCTRVVVVRKQMIEV